MADQVNMQPPSPPYIIEPQIPEHIDAKGVVEAVRGVMQDTQKGFLPIKDIDLQKPYDLLTTHLKEQHERLSNSQLDPDNTIAELKDAKRELERKLKEEFEQRIKDITDRYDGRTGELKDYHCVLEELYKQWSEEWRERFDSMETKRDGLVENLKTALIDYYEKRLSELGKFHEDLKSELVARIQDLERRENDWKTKAENLERERDRHLDERREWLRNREEKFDEEKKDERHTFNDLRKQIVKNEYDVEKTTGQILAEKFSWVWAAVFILVVIIVLCFGIWNFSKTGTSSTPPLSPQTSQEETFTLTLETTTNKEQL